MTPQQAALCEVLYDVYSGVVPARGIESKTVRECSLSVRKKNVSTYIAQQSCALFRG